MSYADTNPQLGVGELRNGLKRTDFIPYISRKIPNRRHGGERPVPRRRHGTFIPQNPASVLAAAGIADRPGLR